jgi:hypothetical protein
MPPSLRRLLLVLLLLGRLLVRLQSLTSLVVVTGWGQGVIFCRGLETS